MANKISKANGHIVQSDWNQTDSNQMDYIHNKPEIPSIEGLATQEEVNNKVDKIATSANKGLVYAVGPASTPANYYNIDNGPLNSGVAGDIAVLKSKTSTTYDNPMTGGSATLVAQEPEKAAHVATKNYVDTNISTINTKLDTKMVPYGGVIQNTNSFGGKKLYINSIDNAFASFSKKFWVQITYHKATEIIDGETIEYPHKKDGAAVADNDYWVDGPLVTTIASFDSQNVELFNNNYEGGIRIPSGQYAKIHMRFSNEEDWTPATGTPSSSVYGSYPYGTFYISYYYTNTPHATKRSQYRCYNTATAHGVGWQKGNFTIYKNSTGAFMESYYDGGAQKRTCMEFIIFGHDDHAAGPTELEWKLDRPYFATHTPLLHNYGTNNVYHAMYFKNRRTTKLTINPAGYIDATSYIKAPIFKGALEGKLTIGNQTYDGSSNITIPIGNYALKSELNNYLPLSGGTISNDLTINGNLTVKGTTYTEDSETLRIADNLIELNSDKIDFSSVLSGLAINKNNSATYGIMYDPADDTVKFGEGTTSNGVFSFAENEGAPLAIRADSSEIEDQRLMIFDKTSNKLIDSGYTLATLRSEIIQEIKDWVSKEEEIIEEE